MLKDFVAAHKQVLSDEEIEKLAEEQYYNLFPTSIERSDYVKGFIKGFKSALQLEQALEKEYEKEDSGLNENLVVNLMAELADDIIRHNKIGRWDIGGMSVFYPYVKEWFKSLQYSADGWIDVKDKLPAKEGEYLCYNASNESIFVSYYDGKWGYFSNETHYVTHWQPLPQPPIKK